MGIAFRGVRQNGGAAAVFAKYVSRLDGKPKLLARSPEFAGKVLVYSCGQGDSCHGAHLAAPANEGRDAKERHQTTTSSKELPRRGTISRQGNGESSRR